jgi:uncharacterized protein YaaQ
MEDLGRGVVYPLPTSNLKMEIENMPRYKKIEEEVENAGGQPDLVNVNAGNKNKYGIVPFVEGEDLPPVKKNAKGDFVKDGDRKYFLRFNDSGVYELISICSSRGGVKRRLVKTLKPKKRNADKVLLGELRSYGVQVM